MTTDKNKVSEPLVSDVKITTLAESYADFEMTKNDGESYSTHLSGFEYGASSMRAIYEAELSRLRQERDELLGALEAEYERLESKCNEDDARGRDSYWVRHYRDFQWFLLKQVSKHKPE
jgi:hypothetical protein